MKTTTTFIVLLLLTQAFCFKHPHQKILHKNLNKKAQAKGDGDDATPEVTPEETNDEGPGLEECNPEIDYQAQLAGLYDRLEGYRSDLEENEAELADLNDSRCTANMLFVESLKEHRLALQIITSLTEMVTDFENTGDAFVQQRQYEKLQTALLAVQSGSDIQTLDMVDDIYKKLNLLQVEVDRKNTSPEDRIYNIMHSTSKTLNGFKDLSEQLKAAPKNLHAILAHVSTSNKAYSGLRNDVEDEVVSYQDLDFESFDSQEMDQLARFEYTPVDIQKLRGDLQGLLNALITHLEESQEDLIQRELAASVAFADWRYDMEDENHELNQGIDNLLQEAQDVAHCVQ